MLFNSYPFIFLFLPVTLIGFWLLHKQYPSLVPLWLVIVSCFFYGWWNTAYLGLLAISISGNYLAGYWIERKVGEVKQILIVVAIGLNLALLGYYKYANFFVTNLNTIFGHNWEMGSIVLPLGISFFTFTQIAFLVDVYRGKAKEYNFINYCLFVTYFPHLIAGPVLHHQQMMPQFKQLNTPNFRQEIAPGLVIFAIGLAKKVLFADGIVHYVTVIFNAVNEHIVLTFAEAWFGALAYTAQLYFDFSGYSDMAIGLSLLFGITLPINFNSPYKAVNIIDFWRRWHITLSNFLRDYLYIPLGGNRHGEFRRYLNLSLTMLLGGLWHGAGWTFMIWGGLHGLYLVLNYAWRGLRKSWGHDLAQTSVWGRIASTTLTFFAVVIAWVFFRANNFTGAVAMLDRMLQIPTSATDLALNLIQNPTEAIAWMLALFAIIFCLPNTQEIINAPVVVTETILQGRGYATEKGVESLSARLESKPIHSVLIGEISYLTIGLMLPVVALLTIIAESQIVKEFIYFNF